jgi:hypothetical protein
MVLIDRTPPAVRHLGANERWDDADFRLQMAQTRYEKRLRMGDRLSINVRKLVRRELAAIHSEWANWFLEKREYGKAREAATDAARIYLTPNLAVKWVLTSSVPGLTRKIVLMRGKRRSSKTAGIG